ncbi:MAG: ABC transporter ATP-binding protein [Cyanobacteria bacterium J06631_6]
MLRLKSAFILIWQAAPNWAIARMAILVLQGILPLASLYLTKLIVDVLAASLSVDDKAAVFEQIILFLILFGIITLVISITSSLGEMVNAAQSQRVLDHVESTLYQKAIDIDIEYYENPHYHDILQRAQREAPYRPNLILQHVTNVVQNLISLVAMAGLLLSLNWIVAGILFSASIPAMVVRFKYAGMMYRWQRRKTEVQRKASYFGWVLSTDSIAKEIRLFDVGKVFIAKFLGLKQELYRQQLQIIKKRSLANLAVQLISGILLLVAYGFIINQTVLGTFKLGDLVLYHQAFKRGQDSLSQLIVNLSQLYEDNLFLANLNEFLALEPKLIEPVRPHPVPQPLRQGIVFDNVSFSYPNTSRTALKNINLTIRPGETIALVGENGSGKTTLVKLLCRLYDISSGKITIDGIDFRDINSRELQRHVSVIFQDFARYNLSAQENIWLGNAALDPEDSRIQAAAHRSGADEVIQSLDRGYQHILGKQFGGGDELSGGQWQKIALARAFLRDSQIIVLDEPTSAMDPKAEERVFRKFRELIANQAAVLVTHRLSTVTMADRIYVMANGSIVESGNHQQLMSLNGIYAELFEIQARNYRFSSRSA